MREHQGFKTSLIPVILMITGLEHVLENIVLAAIVGIGIYAVAVWMEQDPPFLL